MAFATYLPLEPQLQPPDNERFNLRSVVTSPEARLDFEAGDFGLVELRHF